MGMLKELRRSFCSLGAACLKLTGQLAHCICIDVYISLPSYLNHFCREVKRTDLRGEAIIVRYIVVDLLWPM